ncbi:MAG: 6-hydroxymethylpterin diphosphokinase MptE-like protein [Candidatus Freyarchaeota archaeon]
MPKKLSFNEWNSWYHKIIKDFGYSEDKDTEAALVLEKILGDQNPKEQLNLLKEKIHNKCVLVYGCGPSLERNIYEIKRIGLNKICTQIAADGATSALLRENIVPEIIVSDLDGRIEDLISANSKGSILVVHAHGDNIPALKSYVEKMPGVVVGTTQTKPLTRVFNFFGFTDGDRAIFLAYAFGAHTILLAGFDFGDKIGKYSKPEYKGETAMTPTKRKKLEYAKELIKWLASQTNTLIVNLTGAGEIIPGIKNLKWIT